MPTKCEFVTLPQQRKSTYLSHNQVKFKDCFEQDEADDVVQYYIAGQIVSYLRRKVHFGRVSSVCNYEF